MLLIVGGEQREVEPEIAQVASLRVRLDGETAGLGLPPCVLAGLALQALRAPLTPGVGVTRPVVR